jgi:hypothetical protein
MKKFFGSENIAGLFLIFFATYVLQSKIIIRNNRYYNIKKKLLIIIFYIDKLQNLFWTIKFEINKFFFIIFIQIG